MHREHGSSLDFEVVTYCDPLYLPLQMLLPRHSPFKKIINRGLSRMGKMGTLRALARRWGLSSAGHQSGLSKHGRSIDFWQVSAACVGVCSAVALALLILFFEIVHKKSATGRNALGRYRPCEGNTRGGI